MLFVLISQIKINVTNAYAGSSLPMSAKETKALLPTFDENMANALQTDAAWWATHHVELTEKFEQWLAEGGRGLAGSAR
jgi:hypothetical protein